MSNLLEQASLVLIPSGYKAGKVYSEIPIDGSGDMTFARNSDATRIDSAGLVEKVRTNVATYSQEFDNGAWTKSGGATINANTTTAPDGTTTADTINILTNTYSGAYQLISQPSGIYANSIYAKAGTLNYLFVLVNGSSGFYVWFNLSTGTVGSKGVAMEGYIQSVGNGWYRCTATRTTATDNSYIQFGFSDAENFTPTTSGTAYIWGAQAEASDFGPTAYIPTTSSAVSVGPYSNIPRLNYQNGGGGCPSLLLEAQRTNLFTYSEQIDNSDWYKNGLTITANAAISPDGYQNADLLDDGTASSTQHWFYQGPSFSNSTAYTISFYAKYVSRKYMAVNIYNGATSQYVVYDIQNGSVYGSTGDVTASITSVGNGWYRIIYTRTTASSGSPNFRIAMVDDSGNVTYTGSNKQTYLWGLQLEAGSYPSSYIPTLGTSVTRVADDYSRSLTSIASGTAYINIIDNVAQGNPGTHVFGPFAIVSSSLGIFLAKPNNQRLRLWTAAANNIFQTTEINLKLAITWDGTYVNVWQNGVQVVTNYSYAITNVNSMFSSANIETTNSIGQITLFDSILTNAQLAELTA